MVGERGEVWWVDFGEPYGSEPGFRRPVLIVSSDRFNRSKINTVLVCALTRNLRDGRVPGNVELSAGEAGLDKDCVVNVSQTLVVDRKRLVEMSGRVSRGVINQVDQGLRLVLGL